MNNQKISCIYFPTTSIFVDDNKSFLEKIQFGLGNDLLCQTFYDPAQALQHIQQKVVQDSFLQGVIDINSEQKNYTHSSGQLPIQYNISTMYHQAYKKDPFQQISTVIVDYAMPSMNGEQFCRMVRQIKKTPIKIIMLTGEADDPTAIKLFNSGVIDRFLHKAQPNLYADLKATIAELQEQYFFDLTSNIVNALAVEQDSALGDNAFIDFFHGIRQEISAVSYYLIELSGSFLFFDANALPTWLIIKTQKEVNEILDQVEFDISDELVLALQKGEWVPYFDKEAYDHYSNAESFQACLYPAKKLSGKQDYCYAVVKKLDNFPLNSDKIISFKAYLHSL